MSILGNVEPAHSNNQWAFAIVSWPARARLPASKRVGSGDETTFATAQRSRGCSLKPLALGWSMNGRRTVRSEPERCTVWRIVYQSACKHPSKKMHTTIFSWNVFDVNDQHLIRCHKSTPPFQFSWDFRDSICDFPSENWHPSKRANGDSNWSAFVPRRL